jgi:hypothetical protein
MELRPALQIQAIIKAMTDVILPSVDPDNRMAQEQATLVIGMLNLLSQHLPLAYRYDCVELSRLLDLSKVLQLQAEGLEGTSSKALEELAASTRDGENVLDRAKAEPCELERAAINLREKIGALIQTAYEKTDDTGSLHTIGVMVLDAAREQLLRERVWLVSQGWESHPNKLPSIETLIGEKGAPFR